MPTRTAPRLPIDCVFTSEELDTDQPLPCRFENAVSGRKVCGADGVPPMAWAAYLDALTNSCGMDKLLAAQGATTATRQST